MNLKKPYIVDGQRATLEEYRKTKYEDLRVRVAKGSKNSITAHAQERGESLNAFVNRAISDTMENDKRPC